MDQNSNANPKVFFDYQIEGSIWLSLRNSALLADDMGLGKSAQSIAAADIRKLNKVLVICPAIARANWKNQFEKWSIFSRKFKIIYSKKDDRYEDTESVICSFEYAAENKSKLNKTKWDLILVDEIHFLKNHESKRTHAFYNKHDGIIKNCQVFWGLSGTPAPNNISELWVLLRSCGVITLSYDDFVSHFCTYYHFNGRRVVTGTKPERIDEIKKLLSTFMLRRLTKDVLKDMPKIFMQDITVEAGELQYECSKSFVKYVFPIERKEDLFAKVAREEKILADAMASPTFNIENLEKLAKSVPTMRRVVGAQKVDAVVKLISDELDNGAYKKIVVFGVHKDTLENLKEGLRKYNAVLVYGGTPPIKRDVFVKTFQENPDYKVFIGNIEAAGTNIDLTVADNLMMIELSWVPGDNAQAIKRCNRIGSTIPLKVRIVNLADSPLDQKMNEKLARKTNDLAILFDGKDSKTNSLQNDFADDIKKEQQQIAEMLK